VSSSPANTWRWPRSQRETPPLQASAANEIIGGATLHHANIGEHIYAQCWSVLSKANVAPRPKTPGRSASSPSTHLAIPPVPAACLAAGTQNVASTASASPATGINLWLAVLVAPETCRALDVDDSAPAPPNTAGLNPIATTAGTAALATLRARRSEHVATCVERGHRHHRSARVSGQWPCHLILLARQ